MSALGHAGFSHVDAKCNEVKSRRGSEIKDIWRLLLVKVRYGRRCRTCFILLASSVLVSSLQTVVASELSHKSQKNPKLATPLALLSLSVKQETSTSSAALEINPPAGFSAHTLPQQLRDAIRAGQMRFTNSGAVQVYIEVSAVTSENLDALHDNGVTIQILGKPAPNKSRGEVLTKVPTVQGLLPVSMITQVSALHFVRYIRLPDYATIDTGSTDSQGDSALKAELARQEFGVDGTGVRVGIISGGIAGIFASACTTCGPTTDIPSPIILGDLPSAIGIRDSSGALSSVSGGITAQSFRSDGDLEIFAGGLNAEGTAMLEIVHDLAPGAQLYFANFDTTLSFELAVDSLASKVDILVDDVGFFTPPFDGTSDVSMNTARELNTNTNPIRGYFTSVGNSAQTHYLGQYVDSGVDGSGITGEGGHLHAFQAVSNFTTDNAGFGKLITDPIAVPANGVVQVLLSWDDPTGASANDYDLFLVLLSCPNGFSSTLPRPPCSITGAPVDFSIDSQTGTQNPTERVAYFNSTDSPVALGIIIQNVHNAAAARTFDVFITGEPFSDHNFNTVSGSVRAQGDAGGSPVSVVSVGAINQTQCVGASCLGSVEPYSSQGPTEATPQAPSRIKPDLIAVDGVSVTGAGGFGAGNNMNSASCAPGQTPCFFFGTSAASPHAAAIAALVLQASGSVASDPITERGNLRNFLTSTASPLMGISGSAPNNIEGFGLLDARSAVKAALPAQSSGVIGLSPNPAIINIAISGESGSSTITATGVGGFTGKVDLACGISPVPVNDAPTCFVFPSSLILNAKGASATATLTVSTTARLSGAFQLGNPTNKSDYFTTIARLFLVYVLLLAMLAHIRRQILFFGMASALLLGVILTGCANGGSGGSNKINLGTPVGDYTVTVTATSGTTTQTTSVLLSVAQP